MTKAGAGKQNLLLAWEARRARPGRNSCVRNLGAGRGCRPDRSAGRLGGAVPGCFTRRGSGRGKMAAVKGLETCLRVAGAAAARPERFLRYCGLTESPPHPLPDAGHRVRVRARSAAQLVRASVLWEGRARGSRPAPLSSPRFLRDPLKRAVNSVRTWLGLLPRLLQCPRPFFSVRELGNGGFRFYQQP